MEGRRAAANRAAWRTISFGLAFPLKALLLDAMQLFQGGY